MAKKKRGGFTDPREPLDLLRRVGDWNQRKLRLFAAACCRRVWHLLNEEFSRPVVLLAEEISQGPGYKETPKDKERFTAAGRRAGIIVHGLAKKSAQGEAAQAAEYLGDAGVQYAAFHAPAHAANAKLAAKEGGADREPFAQVGLLVDIFGNPLRPVVVEERFRTPIVLDLAKGVYENRVMPTGELDLARLVILADALEEAGYTDGELLAHLRGRGPHVMGCWAVEAALGREP